MHIRTQLLKKRVGPDQEKRIGSMPLVTAASRLSQSRRTLEQEDTWQCEG